jgi:hypothetical protein
MSVTVGGITPNRMLVFQCPEKETVEDIKTGYKENIAEKGIDHYPNK